MARRLALGMRAVGVKSAYEGLTRGVMNELGARDVGGIIQRGGTVLQTARFPEFSKPDVQREALGREPGRPRGFENLEQLPQRCEVIAPDAGAVKRYIEGHAA